MSGTGEVSGYDELAQKAVEASAAPGADEEAQEIASKSERIMRPSMAVSMFRGRQHITPNMDPSNAADAKMDNEPMVIQPLEADAFMPPDEAVEAQGPDLVMVFKAAALRALRGAQHGTLPLSKLEDEASNPEPGTLFNQQVQEHLVDRLLATWAVVDESVKLLVEE